MPRSRVPLFLATVAVVAAVVAFFVLRDSEDEPAPPTTTAAERTTTTERPKPEDDKPSEPEKPELARIVLRDGQPADGVAELSFTEGDEIRFEVVSDIADEIHMHGYDVSEDVSAGGSVKFDVPATITGVFEVESHHGAAQIAEITVNPA